jgi:hypothetical protein
MHDRQSREDHDMSPHQGCASISCDQAPVRICEGALSWFEEEHTQRISLFAPSNLWMVCGKLMGTQECVRPKSIELTGEGLIASEWMRESTLL